MNPTFMDLLDLAGTCPADPEGDDRKARAFELLMSRCTDKQRETATDRLKGNKWEDVADHACVERGSVRDRLDYALKNVVLAMHEHAEELSDLLGFDVLDAWHGRALTVHDLGLGDEEESA